jgi:hypothetical protein
MKPRRSYFVYRTDTDGSERKCGEFYAASEAHAIHLAQRGGWSRITSAVPSDAPSSTELREAMRGRTA